MQIECGQAYIDGSLTPPPSKSHSLRAIIAALLAHSPTKIANLSHCNDIKAACDASEKLGAVWRDGVIYPPERFASSARIDCRDSAAALRFFTCLAACLDGRYVLTGSKRLLSRPMDALIKTLSCCGATVDGPAGGEIVVNGPLHPAKGIINIDGLITSQFISGMLLASPLLPSETRIGTKNCISPGYVDMTLRVMSDFGKKVVFNDGFFVAAEGRYHSAGNVSIVADSSAAAFFAVAAAIAGRVKITGLDLSFPQPDSEIFAILASAGAEVVHDGGTIAVCRKTLSRIAVDCDLTPDLAPVAAVAGAFSENGAEILHADRLTTKESDRKKAVMEMICSLGGRAEYKNGSIIVYGGGLKGGFVRTYGDHRIAMSAAVAATSCPYKVIIDDGDCVSKSYPEFWRDYRALGGRVY